MNDNENTVLCSSEPAITGNPESALENEISLISPGVIDPVADQAVEEPRGFESLTYVSSQGFFFH